MKNAKMNNNLPLNKLIIMYVLHIVDSTLSKSQLEECILELKYLNYFVLQDDISYLYEIKYIKKNVVGNRTILSLTPQGSEALKLLISHIPNEIKEEINNYLSKNSYKLVQENSVQCETYKETNGEYIFHGIIKEGDETIFDIKLSFPTMNMAEKVAANWRKRSDNIYIKIIEGLS